MYISIVYLSCMYVWILCNDPKSAIFSYNPLILTRNMQQSVSNYAVGIDREIIL